MRGSKEGRNGTVGKGNEESTTTREAGRAGVSSEERARIS